MGADLTDRLATALSELMGAEGGEPNDFDAAHVAAWEEAESALAEWRAANQASA